MRFPCAALEPSRPPSQYKFDEWVSPAGLPYPAIRALGQDRDGYLWIGTRAGMARFDGVALSPFRQANLPIMPANGVTAPRDASGAPSSAQIQGRAVRILIAEDNLVNQKMARRMVERLGHVAVVVSDGRQALDALARGDFALVLMDGQMPEMDGYEATRQLRQREGAGRHTIVVGLTANALEGERERCLELGMDDFLAKPINYADLGRVIARWTEPRV